MCAKTPPLRFHRVPPFSTSTAHKKAKPYRTAAISFLPTISTTGPSRAEVLFIFLAVSFDIIRKAVFTTQFDDVIRVPGDPSFDIDLINKTVEFAKGCNLIVSVLIGNIPNEQ